MENTINRTSMNLDSNNIKIKDQKDKLDRLLLSTVSIIGIIFSMCD